MPFKSQAQRRFMYAAESRGDVPKGTAKHWEEATPKGKKLPERVKKEHAMTSHPHHMMGLSHGAHEGSCDNAHEFKGHGTAALTGFEKRRRYEHHLKSKPKAGASSSAHAAWHKKAALYARGVSSMAHYHHRNEAKRLSGK